MEFSGEDQDLVQIVESADAIAEAIQQLGLTKRERRGPVRYVEILVNLYIDKYRTVYSEMPSRSLFSEAINQYLDVNYDNGRLRYSKQIKQLMRDLILTPYDQYRSEVSKQVRQSV